MSEGHHTGLENRWIHDPHVKVLMIGGSAVLQNMIKFWGWWVSKVDSHNRILYGVMFQLLENICGSCNTVYRYKFYGVGAYILYTKHQKHEHIPCNLSPSMMVRGLLVQI